MLLTEMFMIEKTVVVPDGFDTTKVWYHGSDKRLRKFDRRRMDNGEIGIGVYLADKFNIAYAWARSDGFVMNCYIRKGDIFDLATLNTSKSFKELHRRHTQFMNQRHGGSNRGYSKKQFADVLLRSGNYDHYSRLLSMLGYVGAVDHRTQVPGQIIVYNPDDVFIFKIAAGKDWLRGDTR